MSKFVGIKTYERFRSLWENNAIDEFSLNFILDTGQLYTHGIFINSAVFGTAANGAVPLSIAGTTNTLALSSHTHSQYYNKNEDIDISNHKIISGDKDLLFCSGGALYLGNTTNPTYISGSSLYSVKGQNTYTILDTGNFSISNTLPSGYTHNNTAYIKYGDSSFQIDYVKRINTSQSFDYLNSYTQAGTNQLNGVYYGYINFTVDNVYTNPAWAQLRINIPGKSIQYRTSADVNNWISMTDSTAVKLGTAGDTNITNGSVISALSYNGIIFQGGTNSFKVGNGTNSINISVNHGLSTKNITINGSTYALYTSASSLPTILAPTTLGTDGQILGTNGTTLEWKTLDKDNQYTATLSEVDLTTSWSNVDNLNTRLIESGSYIIQITYASCIYTGTFSYVQGGTVDDEIILHCSGTIDSVGGTNRGRLYAKIGTSSETTYLKLAVSQSESNVNLSIKYRKLI